MKKTNKIKCTDVLSVADQREIGALEIELPNSWEKFDFRLTSVLLFINLKIKYSCFN